MGVALKRFAVGAAKGALLAALLILGAWFSLSILFDILDAINPVMEDVVGPEAAPYATVAVAVGGFMALAFGIRAVVYPND